MEDEEVQQGEDWEGQSECSETADIMALNQLSWNSVSTKASLQDLDWGLDEQELDEMLRSCPGSPNSCPEGPSAVDSANLDEEELDLDA